MNGVRQTYRYCWKNNSKRATLYDRELIVLARLPANSALVEFVDNGQREVISRNAIRKWKPSARQIKEN